ncbi:MAG: hypothetical protein GXO99_07170 [Nitrospirae bacterium]|nr:hypothetical protein [Nitrospirota bacterium]
MELVQSGSLSSGVVFGALVLFSLILVISFYWGGRRNLKIIRSVASLLEDALHPIDKQYTWLGGTVGFRASYRIKGFRDVVASLTVVPRQSLLYLPVAFIRGAYDRLEILFFLEGPIDEEIHLIRGREIKRFIPDRERINSLDKKSIEYRDETVWLLFSKEQGRLYKLFSSNLQRLFGPALCHIAVVPERGTFYLNYRVRSNDISSLKEEIRAALKFIKRYMLK